jgi:hypothetical protein
MPSDSTLWRVAVLLFVLGDLVTTALGLHAGATETSPVGQTLLGVGGLWALAGAKVAFVGALWVARRWVPRQWRAGIPLGLALVGGATTGWNLAILAALVV